jgi:hypothetical protein
VVLVDAVVSELRVADDGVHACESETAWHGPGDVSPVGHAANIALDLACANFGIQESSHFNDASG